MGERAIDPAGHGRRTISAGTAFEAGRVPRSEGPSVPEPLLPGDRYVWGGDQLVPEPDHADVVFGGLGEDLLVDADPVQPVVGDRRLASANMPWGGWGQRCRRGWPPVVWPPDTVACRPYREGTLREDVGHGPR